MTELTAKRKAIIRDNGKCRMCYRGGVWLLHAHHIHPKAQGGVPNDPDNIITLCLACHLGIVHGGRIDDGANPEGNWNEWTHWCKWQIADKPRF